MRHKITKEAYESLLEECMSEVFDLFVGHRYFLQVAWNEETYVGVLYDAPDFMFHSVSDFLATKTTLGRVNNGQLITRTVQHEPNFVLHQDQIRTVYLRYDSEEDAKAHGRELVDICMDTGRTELPEFEGVTVANDGFSEAAKQLREQAFADLNVADILDDLATLDVQQDVAVVLKSPS